jgi:diguanylate cyclase (GGDEF)-like protein
MPRIARRLRDLLGSDQGASDADQTDSDADQTSSDADQTVSDRDQAAAEADQLISDSDQEAADLEFEASQPSGARRTHVYEEAQAKRGEGTLARSATSAVRIQVSAERDAEAGRRDERARRRDETAAQRDSAADLADQEAAELAGSAEHIDDRTRVVLGAAASARSKAAAARVKAAEDRRHAASDREAAARDREQLHPEILPSQLDESTGAYRRGIGELLISHEIEHESRVHSDMHLAVIKVGSPEASSDDLGDAPGDVALRRVFLGLQARLRPYDPIVRWDGDEFVCALTGVTAGDARGRVLGAQSDLAEQNPGISVSTGMAVLENDDTLTTLVGRAHTALVEAGPRSP